MTSKIWARLPILLQLTYEMSRKLKPKGVGKIFLSRREKSKGITFVGECLTDFSVDRHLDFMKWAIVMKVNKKPSVLI